eukprot:CAMPEP_0178514226 /NCGR_PEP_ID=MMETSP0696-20121128/23906_1 /TAXON_ID=265572 /ORGANISM="Extubocellulus spinifer, Strain CCMP396" /LENGTH=437 /DNA_ID=CAMNT_0020144299 /DNA_START=15 /DNA_END=1328 /DNA_ORIENTATION=-
MHRTRSLLVESIRPRRAAAAAEVAVRYRYIAHRRIRSAASSGSSVVQVHVLQNTKNVWNESSALVDLVATRKNIGYRNFSPRSFSSASPNEKEDDVNSPSTNLHQKSQDDASSSSSSTPRSTPPDAPVSLSSSSYPPSAFVDQLPPSLQPYARLARLDKPIGTMLLLWPCCWSTALAAPPGCLPDPTLLALFATGSFVMRGAGCTINDMWDADYDRSVARTRDRPLASGELSYGQALTFLAAQLTAGLGVLLSLPHTAYTFQVGAASLPLVVAYPLMKRYTNWPQLVLGMTFNWGAIVGWASVHGSIDWSVVAPLYGSGIAWTLVYDTLYAHQDKVDDRKLGLKSTALHFADRTKPILNGFSALAVANWMAAGYALEFTSPLYYCGCAAAYLHLVWQVQTADLDNPPNLAQRFKSNNYVGAIVFASCVAGNLTAAAV